MSSESEFDPSTLRPSRAPWLLLLLALVAAGALGYAAWKALQQTEAAERARDEAGARLAKAQAGQAGLEAQLTGLQREKNELAASAEQLKANLQQTEAELSRLKATYDSLEDKLKAEIGRGDIRLSQAGDRIQVDLVDKILFDSGQAALSERGQEVLGRLASVLKTIDDKQIQVSGHTDDSPITSEELRKQFPSNWELSVARAVNVVRQLAEVGGVPPQRLLAAGYGQFHPLTGNATAKGRAQNRRIEILLTPELAAKKAALSGKPTSKK
ncbi:MAG: putative chemotaxis MotB protein [Myxococcaceae bacterium]|nr:putative chemotaxis MotB protein [Myxococcaceae bacterium]